MWPDHCHFVTTSIFNTPAHCFNLHVLFPTSTFKATSLWVARVTLLTITDRIVVWNPALSIWSTVTRVHTQSIDARLLKGTLRVGCATDIWGWSYRGRERQRERKKTILAHHRKLYVTLIPVSLISKWVRKTGKFQILIS